MTTGDADDLPVRDQAALAPNWRSPLRVDLCIGLAVALLGVSIATGGRVGLGVAVAAGGAAYVTLVLRRWRRWAAIRRSAGLE